MKVIDTSEQKMPEYSNVVWKNGKMFQDYAYPQQEIFLIFLIVMLQTLHIKLDCLVANETEKFMTRRVSISVPAYSGSAPWLVLQRHPQNKQQQYPKNVDLLQ